MLAHGHDFGDDGLAGPIHAEDLGQLLQILRGGFSYREDGVSKPAHAERAQFLIKELNAELARQQWNVLDDC